MIIKDYNKIKIKKLLFNILIEQHPNKLIKYKQLYNKYINKLYGMRVGSKIVKYLDEEYEFFNMDEDSDNEINVYILQAKNTDSTCVMITINKNEYIATLSNLSTEGLKCSDKLSQNVGSHMIKITIKFIKKYFTFIKGIELIDHSYILCKLTKQQIYLGNLMVLKTGHTFYGREGFRPYNPDNKQDTKELVKSYNNNIKIMEYLTIKESNVIFYISKYLKKYNDNTHKINKILEYATNHLDMKFTKFFEKIFKKDLFDELCDFINYILLKLISHNGLTNFHNKKFILFL